VPRSTWSAFVDWTLGCQKTWWNLNRGERFQGWQTLSLDVDSLAEVGPPGATGFKTLGSGPRRYRQTSGHILLY
jgi:hypothetical protein